MTLATCELPTDSIESAQRHPDGSPRFLVPARRDHDDWARAEATEANEGVSAELRIFLDAQLEAGDVLVDVAPAFGFVALGAATAPSGAPSVFVLEQSPGIIEALQSSARQASGWIDAFGIAALVGGTLTDQIVERLPDDARVFIHSDLTMLSAVLKGLEPLVLLGRVVGCGLSIPPEADESALQSAAELLHALGFRPHVVRDQEGEPQLYAVTTLSPDSCVIAIAGTTSSAAIAVEETPDYARSARTLAPPPFSFTAPYCRTGYGIVGAHLLREFLQHDAPVAYFPLGQIDTTVMKDTPVRMALARQGAFGDMAPSVRLSQQFDLALHVGRGPKIGFPIFELDYFNAYERHHLAQQDRLLVTCAWARDVLLENGITHTPIDIVPLGVDRAVFHEHVPFTASTTDTTFMSVGKLERRKGQGELLRAFEAAFTSADDVQLVLVCHNPFVDEKTFAELVRPFRVSPMALRITLVTTPLPTQRELATVMASADCAVFPIRAEGWNLEALEMLSMGKTVIATNCTGHTAYLTNDNARLIAVDSLEPSMPEATKGRWAAWGKRQHEQLVSHLREVHAARRDGSLGVNDSGVQTARRLSWSASANALMRSVAAA